MIVARNEARLYSYAREHFAGDDIEVVMDRRQGERRQGRAVPDGERRQTDRRAHRTDDRLKTYGWVVVNAVIEPDPSLRRRIVSRWSPAGFQPAQRTASVRHRPQ